MKDTAVVAALLMLLISGPARSVDTTDVLGRILAEVGFSRENLGYAPAGYWNRFPQDTPHKLNSFDDLFAEPLRLYDYSQVMANAVEQYLDPTRADSLDDGLYHLVYNLGVEKKFGGFRSYSANLITAPDGDRPVIEALDYLQHLAGQRSRYKAFGQDGEWPRHRFELADRIASIPDTIRHVLAELLINLGEAIYWHILAFRNCDHSDLQTAFDIRDLAETQTDGAVYHPELDDIAGAIDWASLFYSALKTVAAAEQAERKLVGLADRFPDTLDIDLATPFGRVVLLPGKNDPHGLPPTSLTPADAESRKHFEIDAANTLLLIDFGRNTIYQGSPGATSSLSNPISVLIDLAGDDYYGHGRTSYPPSTGVGLMGVGVAIDSEGDDHYSGSTYAQGAGLFGVGVLLDRSGDDHYRAETSAQGAGYFGIGICLDATGDDEYYLWGDGQGMGGVGGGIGVCASFSGNDKYTAEPYSRVVDRGDYHSDHKINGNNAQGAGFGRRGDGSDGHSWAGGLGAIMDIHGDDHYYSGNWTLGVGYWFATGIALDRNGNDKYESCYFTQASGAHYCNGVLIDQSGDDEHILYETAGAALGFGWDYTNALLVNLGGDDHYRARIISMGLAQIRSNAFLIDVGGDDVYELGKGTPGLGEASWREGYDKPSPLLTYYYYSRSFGGFIDIGGDDTYWEFDSAGREPHPVAAENSLWLQPSRDDERWGADNFGVGIDIESGVIPEVEMWGR